MSDESELGPYSDVEMDKPLTRRELIAMLDPYNKAISSLASCMINVTTGMRASESPDVAFQGSIAFDKLDEVIYHLEDITRRFDTLLRPKESDQ